MDFDKLQEALANPEVAALFEQRTEALAAIEEHETELQSARQVLSGIEAQIAEHLGVNLPSGGGRKPQVCGNCGEAGHNAKRCPNPKKEK